LAWTVSVCDAGRKPLSGKHAAGLIEHRSPENSSEIATIPRLRWAWG
jgi:hypothetical protein